MHFTFLDGVSVTGYVINLTSMSPSHNRERRYFQFTLQTEKIEKREVCFSPEKHKLLSKLEENQVKNLK